eukprot:CAMPEP_0168555470 /NCGR_PEP_ID=MMETSP0413-20121227/8354_1 /TAXON_ID=136452 /ORGANISM="Filamoeba nolandi, Strain NC-AS-23-1" /LENGTH=575 /DNA_ID=CAMNT_0008586327 /DNA_START=26 /DNA_END=1753 /DNA_ORIENTATION=-
MGPELRVNDILNSEIRWQKLCNVLDIPKYLDLLMGELHLDPNECQRIKQLKTEDRSRYILQSWVHTKEATIPFFLGVLKRMNHMTAQKYIEEWLIEDRWVSGSSDNNNNHRPRQRSLESKDATFERLTEFADIADTEDEKNIPSDFFVPGHDEYTQGIKLWNNGDIEAALALFLKAKELHYPPAFLKLSQMDTSNDQARNEAKRFKQWFEVMAKHSDHLFHTHNLASYEFWIEKNEAQAFKLWQTPAETHQNAYAQYNLGVLYYIKQNYEAAVKWFTKAAEKGHVRAQFCLGACYFDGKGMESSNVDEAIKWISKAAENNDAVFAQVGLGWCFEKQKQFDSAVKWYKKAAESQSARAQCCLGWCYEYGLGVPKNPQEAVKWYKQAADRSSARALYCLGVCYENGIGVPADLWEAITWYQRAAAQDSARAQYRLGRHYELENKYAEAFKMYRSAAKNKLAAAQNALAKCFLRGNGVKQNFRKAYRWFEAAVQNGEIGEAQYYLGFCYEHGFGVQQDSARAVEWYKEAATKGYLQAQWNLFLAYKGYGGSHYQQAVLLFSNLENNVRQWIDSNKPPQ